MSDNLRSLAKEHHAFYEVLPHYVVLEERHGSSAASRVQAGFDVEICAANIKNDLALPGPDPDYALGSAELQKIAESISHQATGSCSLEVISFPSTVVVDSQNDAKVEAMFRIRISHCRGLDQPPARQNNTHLRKSKTSFTSWVWRAADEPTPETQGLRKSVRCRRPVRAIDRRARDLEYRIFK